MGQRNLSKKAYVSLPYFFEKICDKECIIVKIIIRNLGGNNIEEKYYKIWISLIKDLGIKRYTSLIKEFKSLKSIFSASKEQIISVYGIGEKIANQIIDLETKRIAKKHLEYMCKNGIDIISIEESKYPELLRNIYDPPISIYIKGNKDILNSLNLAIIGCREATEYGKNIAQSFAYNLAKKNVNIVSGLARGIDSNAHLGAVYAKGKTIAVLGNGVDLIYPKENIYLARKILENGGVIISEYPIGTEPNKINFPARNRIISGISKGVLIVEAKEKSGTLITVDFALEQGRDVFAIPGNIDSKNSFGTNELIKQGAKLVTNYEEILEEYEK